MTIITIIINIIINITIVAINIASTDNVLGRCAIVRGDIFR